MRALILPNQNADVEKKFSAMTYVKSTYRHNAKIGLLNAILVIKSG